MDSHKDQHPAEEETHELLRKLTLYELLEPLCKAQGESAYVDQHKIEHEARHLSDKEAIDCLRKDVGAQDLDQLHTWSKAHGLSSLADLADYAQKKQKKIYLIDLQWCTHFKQSNVVNLSYKL